MVTFGQLDPRARLLAVLDDVEGLSTEEAVALVDDAIFEAKRERRSPADIAMLEDARAAAVAVGL